MLHWSLEHPEKEPVFKCAEEGCTWETGDVDKAFKHRSKHSTSGAGGGGGGRTGQDRNEKCDVCKRSYPRSYLHSHHKKIHEGKVELSCYVCSKVFLTVGELKAHSLSHVPDEDKYVHCCELCGKRFTQRANLEAHLRVHSGFKPFSCEFCGKTFSQKGNMDEHKRTHTGEKPYVCETCGSAFVRRSELLLHVRCAHTGKETTEHIGAQVGGLTIKNPPAPSLRIPL